MRVSPRALFAALICLAGIIAPQASFGRSYNRVDYQLAARLDAAADSIHGQATVLFHNGTDRPFSELVFHLYPNAYRPGSHFVSTMMRDGREEGELFYHPGQGAYGRMDVQRVTVGGQQLEPRIDGTIMRVALPAPALPGEKVELKIDFVTKIPHATDRLKVWQGIYSAALWYPKVAVYDDNGWDTWQFDSLGEFYGDFGDYKVSITLPEDFVCGASGVLEETRHNGDSTKTETYQAANVHDFAWVASRRYVKTETAWNGIKIYVLLPAGYETDSPRIHAAARQALQYYSGQYGPYPYPCLTIGYTSLGFAMEYPTLVMEDFPDELDGWFSNGLYSTLGHEIAHQWWYGMVGNNEHAEPFMDESFAEYAACNFVEDRFPGEPTSVRYPQWLSFMYLFRRQDLRYDELLFYRRILRSQRDIPLATSSEEYPPGYIYTPYSKGTAVLMALEELVGGREKMTALLRAYSDRYRFQNVSSGEFELFVSSHVGRDMSWFFDDWVYGRAQSDLKLSAVRSAPAGTGFRNSATITQQGNAHPFPVKVAVTSKDGSRQVMLSSGMAASETLVWETTSPVRKMVVDPGEMFPEANRFNNRNTIDLYAHVNFPSIAYQYKFDRPFRSAAGRLLQNKASSPLTEYLPADKYSLILTPLFNAASDGSFQSGLESAFYKKDYYSIKSRELYDWKKERWQHALEAGVPLTELTRSFKSNITATAGKDEFSDSRYVGAGLTLYLSPYLSRNPSHTLGLLALFETFGTQQTRSGNLSYLWATNLTDYRLNGHQLDLFGKSASPEQGSSWAQYRIGLEKYFKLFWLCSLRLKGQYGDSSRGTPATDWFYLSDRTPMERREEGGTRYDYLGAEMASPLIYDLSIRSLHGSLGGSVFYNRGNIEEPVSALRAEAGAGLNLAFSNPGYAFNLASRHYFLNEDHGNPAPADDWVVELSYQVKF